MKTTTGYGFLIQGAEWPPMMAALSDGKLEACYYDPISRSAARMTVTPEGFSIIIESGEDLVVKNGIDEVGTSESWEFKNQIIGIAKRSQQRLAKA